MLKEKLRRALLPRSEAKKKHKIQRILKYDKETGFPITGIEELDTYIEKFKKEKSIGLNVKSEFDSMLYKLIQRFNVKSETQLIRILRISIANARKGGIKEKLRA